MADFYYQSWRVFVTKVGGFSLPKLAETEGLVAMERGDFPEGRGGAEGFSGVLLRSLSGIYYFCISSGARRRRTVRKEQVYPILRQEITQDKEKEMA
ncbi:MAG: hypothetical protein NC210_10020, partial [[Clostridium] fimetarium]|nr:hypothetical protein [[Clostridium] fimetarium]